MYDAISCVGVLWPLCLKDVLPTNAPDEAKQHSHIPMYLRTHQIREEQATLAWTPSACGMCASALLPNGTLQCRCFSIYAHVMHSMLPLSAGRDMDASLSLYVRIRLLVRPGLTPAHAASCRLLLSQRRSFLPPASL